LLTVSAAILSSAVGVFEGGGWSHFAPRSGTSGTSEVGPGLRVVPALMVDLLMGTARSRRRRGFRRARLWTDLDLVFTDLRGGPHNHDRVRRAFDKALDAARRAAGGCSTRRAIRRPRRSSRSEGPQARGDAARPLTHLSLANVTRVDPRTVAKDSRASRPGAHGALPPGDHPSLHPAHGGRSGEGPRPAGRRIADRPHAAASTRLLPLFTRISVVPDLPRSKRRTPRSCVSTSF